uniref:Homeobox domain-containing protein n=1 Tax=Oncorhynchus kisutch TaxID=8019 RepID=A0A8C7FDA4_ONCKI
IKTLWNSMLARVTSMSMPRNRTFYIGNRVSMHSTRPPQEPLVREKKSTFSSSYPYLLQVWFQNRRARTLKHRDHRLPLSQSAHPIPSPFLPTQSFSKLLHGIKDEDCFYCPSSYPPFPLSPGDAGYNSPSFSVGVRHGRLLGTSSPSALPEVRLWNVAQEFSFCSQACCDIGVENPNPTDQGFLYREVSDEYSSPSGLFDAMQEAPLPELSSQCVEDIFEQI